MGGGDISQRGQKTSETSGATDGQRGRQGSEIISFLNETGPGVRKISADHVCPCTLVVDLKANGAHALVRLKVEPHLVGHADNQVWHKAPRQPAGHRRQTDIAKAVVNVLNVIY